MVRALGRFTLIKHKQAVSREEISILLALLRNLIKLLGQKKKTTPPSHYYLLSLGLSLSYSQKGSELVALCVDLLISLSRKERGFYSPSSLENSREGPFFREEFCAFRYHCGWVPLKMSVNKINHVICVWGKAGLCVIRPRSPI